MMVESASEKALTTKRQNDNFSPLRKNTGVSRGQSAKPPWGLNYQLFNIRK